MLSSPTRCHCFRAVHACLYQGGGRVHRLQHTLACGSSHWFSLQQGKNRASGESSFYHLSSEASLLSGDLQPDLWLERRHKNCMTAFPKQYFGDREISKKLQEFCGGRMIALSEKLILDCSKGIYKVAQILKSGFSSPNLCAVVQHASKQKILLKSGTKCRLRVGFCFLLFYSVDLNMHAEFSSGPCNLESGLL